MRKPNKKLRNLGIKYIKLGAEYKQAVHEYVKKLKCMDADTFWYYLDYFARDLIVRDKYRGDSVGSAVHNTMIYIQNDTRSPLDQWVACAQFYATYSDISNKLHKQCWSMPGVNKSDDGYSDWTDALPLSGRNVIEGILNDKIVNYRQVDEAINEFRPNLKSLIQNGENYIHRALSDHIIKRFAHAAIREECED